MHEHVLTDIGKAMVDIREHNQSLQQTLDPVAILAIAKPAPASIAAEPRR